MRRFLADLWHTQKSAAAFVLGALPAAIAYALLFHCDDADGHGPAFVFFLLAGVAGGVVLERRLMGPS